MHNRRERHVPMSLASSEAPEQAPAPPRDSRALSAAGGPPPPAHKISIRKQLEIEMRKMEEDLERFRLEKEQRKSNDSSNQNKQRQQQQQQQVETNSETAASNMSEREASSTPSSLINDPLANLAATNRATTTERRTTTTTTTKRTVKSSDDFIPTATDIQQVRSESRTGSISATSSPLFSASSGATQQQQQSSSSSSSTHQTTTSSGKQTSTAAASKNWAAESGLQSPLIQDTEEGRVLKLRFDVTQYEPDEIVVKTVDNRLTVHAKHEEKSENRSVYREYNREFHLPDGTDVEQIRSSLSKDGVLTVDCPLPSPQLHGASRRIPIEKV